MERPLTRREQELLAQLAAREAGADPAFARRMGGVRPGRRGSSVPWLVVGALAVIGVALLVVPGVYVLAAVATAVLLVVPVALIAWAMHQGDPPPRM
jgi:type VI protein secretion system component VasF